MKYLTALEYKCNYLLQDLIKICLFWKKKYIRPEMPVLRYTGKINKATQFWSSHLLCVCFEVLFMAQTQETLKHTLVGEEFVLWDGRSK